MMVKREGKGMKILVHQFVGWVADVVHSGVVGLWVLPVDDLSEVVVDVQAEMATVTRCVSVLSYLSSKSMSLAAVLAFYFMACLFMTFSLGLVNYCVCIVLSA